jgi:threonine dehydrogenase-like Zn-dependent dehydrogenase
VAVSGLGLVGHLAARIFDSCGYQVIACDPLESRRALVAAAGIARVEARLPMEDPAVAGRVGLVLECSGHEQAVLDGCAVVRRRGEVVLVGVPWARMTDLSARDLLHTVFHRYVVLRSGWEWELPLHATDFRNGSIYGNLATALQWLAQGRINVEGLSTVMPAMRAQDAYQALLHRTNPRLGIILDWRTGNSTMG